MAIVTDGLVLYLHGACGKNNPATRVWKDLSGNGNDGKLVNFGYTEDSGWVDGGLRFDGVDDWMDCGQIPELNKEETITVEVFIKFNYLDYETGTGNIVTIACKGITDTRSPHSGFMFTYDNRNNRSDFNYTSFGNSEGGYAGGGNNFSNVNYKFETDKLYHLAFTINNSIGKFFINGIQIGDSKQFKNLRLLTEKPLQFSHWGSHKEPMEISSFRIYNRALTDEEILQNYQAGYEWTPVKGKREVTTTMKPITSSLSRKGTGRREVITTVKPITTSLERKGVGKREVISTMKPITSELNRKGVGRREVITTMQPITSSISKKLPPIHADMDVRERIPKLEVD